MLTVCIMTGSVWCKLHNACLQISKSHEQQLLAHNQFKTFKIHINYFKNKHNKNIIH